MDPYRVLGVSPKASDDDVKKAYRTLIRKYHPDANINNPNKDEVEDHFQSVQRAYDKIMRERQNGGFNSGGYAYSNRDEEGDEVDVEGVLTAAENFIQTGYYKEAITALKQAPNSARLGSWYYLAARADYKLDNIPQAKIYIDKAVLMEPGNFQFRQLQTKIQTKGGFSSPASDGSDPGGGSTGWYERRGRNYGRPYDSLKDEKHPRFSFFDHCINC